MEELTLSFLVFLQEQTRALNQSMEEAARFWQITPSEVKILLFLRRMPQLDTASDVARHCSMSKASVSGNVLKLVSRGLLTADMDLKDRRLQRLRTTKQAEPVLETIDKAMEQFCRQSLHTLTQQERQTLEALLKKLNPTEVLFNEERNRHED